MIDEKFHEFSIDVSDIELPHSFTNPFDYVPHKLSLIASEEVYKIIDQQDCWKKDLIDGKMFGVLVVKTLDNKLGFLASFSGNIDGKNQYEYFVPPIYDLLSEDNFFKREEREINIISQKISDMEKSEEYITAKQLFEKEKIEVRKVLDKEKLKLKSNKEKRERLRNYNIDKGYVIDQELNSRLIKESQRDKSLYKELERNKYKVLKDLENSLLVYDKEITSLKQKRKLLSSSLQQKISKHFILLNIRKERQSIYDIFNEGLGQTAPSGTGECALPKLLNYAYLHNYLPICMAEFWWQEDDRGSMRKHKNFYPSCKGKCEPLLNFMLHGVEVEKGSMKINISKDFSLEVLYEDDYIIAVNKPHDILSVDGKDDKNISLEYYVRKQYSLYDIPIVIHRLDMATSGIILFAKTTEANSVFSRLFEGREVKKKYVALLEPTLSENKPESTTDKGVINLPLSADYINRPRQKVNLKEGKTAITYYEIIERTRLYTKVNFYPVTGRTHQLRVHSAHKEGLSSAIIGDAIYGKKSRRMFLHAEEIEFLHPFTNEKIKIVKPNDFHLFTNFLGEPLQEQPKQ